MNFSIIHLAGNHLSTSPLFTMKNIRAQDIRFSRIISSVFYNTNYLNLYRAKFEKSLATPIYFNKLYTSGSISSRLFTNDAKITLEDCYFNEIYASGNVGSALYISGADFTNVTQCSFTKCMNNKKCGAFYINSTEFELTYACFYKCRSTIECSIGIVLSEIIVWVNSVAYKCVQESEVVDSTLKLISQSNTLTRMNSTLCDSDINSGVLSVGSVRMEYASFFNNTGRSLAAFHNATKNIVLMFVFAFYNKGNLVALFDINGAIRMRLLQLVVQQNEGKVFKIQGISKEIDLADSFIDVPLEPGISTSFEEYFNVTTGTPSIPIQEYAVCIPIDTDSESARSPQIKKYITAAYIFSAVVVFICVIIIVISEIRQLKLKKMN
ncbi:hypothetical protein TVAG_419020 [Trichomonas vaginalis G3]|uniref:Uncharacterized protein n=1 Tax=Trichomonas vaginalis (strain ATCC PRA-98 / G3) TaxID=412133 RepID=A2F5H3_TRIV3|nr:hypothetical protein TVAGG3_0158200 [Trichomonas vaginalis G3]EAX99845.1 hypothetical protein TVAG_419020 [Trichomonas vaginalis G3]KAI5547685.1 hypothetical protein TVAGG3_0158200 [Trichomonas vaginalis G3]|eukprot:XP_001312775.1 hypothetical protein [Trichomonas vaginalis G3]